MKTHLDLFSGIGGFAIAAQACGYTTIGFCEKELYAQQILKERFGAVLADAESAGTSTDNGGIRSRASRTNRGQGTITPHIHPDIFTLNGADYAGVDLLTGGFPCQPFSVAGKRLGKADNRALWPEMLRVIDGAKPAWLIGENVAGIVTMELDNILSDLEAIGYTAWPLVIPACAVDARHRRDRVWIIARRDVEDAASERSGGASGNALHEGREAIQTGGASIPQAARRKNGSAIGDNRAAGEDAADSHKSHCQGDERTERGRTKCAVAGEHSERRLQGTRRAESGVGGMVDGLPAGMDGSGAFCQWPEEDHETPRVTTGMKHRAHRLRGLGNAIVPQVAEEIIRAIATIEE
ncbi:Dcm Site-specific DNA methylase [uncultured Caudovirales phage]|uniref:DNA (cytosine-5-)-methyltransferase n=1 Tax=uncultured Caudovirales phage TaxID=2100421 RepID=A0A6J5RVI3_9CAUD|nr:Dcm Site-specific DNA methylase [uncultured Caudovirales phage]CAB4199993.1 Dcm Site-specific DNA methylase [uncultured Caudovirales phage]CAB5238526.1 Dcm Site-specific DNA methylase [uncultured Caudovirales phage]